MNDSTTLPHPDPQQRAGHELSDIDPFSVAKFALGLALMIAAVLFVLAWTFWRLEATAQRRDVPQSSLTAEQTPPSPRLQDDPAADLMRFRRDEEQRLSSYGWVDPKQRVVRIPIQRAIEILSERGLPDPQGPSEPPADEEDAK